jgi:hypothetical protein
LGVAVDFEILGSLKVRNLARPMVDNLHVQVDQAGILFACRCSQRAAYSENGNPWSHWFTMSPIAFAITYCVSM